MATAPTTSRIPGWQQILMYLVVIAITIGITRYVLAKPDSEQVVLPPFDAVSGAMQNDPASKPSMYLQITSAKSIDGNLNDWDFEQDNESRYFKVHLDADKVYKPDTIKDFTNCNAKNQPGTALSTLITEQYSFQGAVMEDASNLYIAAKIGDPTRSLIDNTKLHNGDTATVIDLDDAHTPESYLQIRFSPDSDKLDPKLRQERSFELHLWSNKTGQTYKTYLGRFPGLTTTEKEKDNGLKTIESGTEGFQCVFKQVKGDAHCVIEAKIPWSVLPHRPAPDVDEMRCLWHVTRLIGKERIRAVALVDDTHPKFKDLLSSIKLINELDPGIALWGKIKRKQP